MGCAQEITSSAQLDTFVQSQPENVLTVVNISSYATPCVRVFPAVLALAKNFVGYAAFGRLLYESSDKTQALANQLKVREVWTTLSALPMVCVTPSSVHQTKHCDCRQGSCAGQAHVFGAIPCVSAQNLLIPMRTGLRRALARTISMAGWVE